MWKTTNYPLYDQYARLVRAISKNLKISLEDALYKFYNSKTYTEMNRRAKTIPNGYGDLGDDHPYVDKLMAEIQ